MSACRGNMRTKRYANSAFTAIDSKSNKLYKDVNSNGDQVKTNSDVKVNDVVITETNQVLSVLNTLNTKDNLYLFSKFNWNRVIYANTDGYAVVEPGSKGEYMIRSVCKAFKNSNIMKYDFDQIMVQIRKILIKIMGTSKECAAQVIDDRNDIPKSLFFN